MDINTAKYIVEIAERIGEDLSLYEGYSGRGMFGETTAAVVGYRGDLDRTIAHIVESNDSEGRAFVAKLMRRIRQDNMGKQMIFY